MKLIATAIVAFVALTSAAYAGCCKCCDKPAQEQSQTQGQPHH